MNYFKSLNSDGEKYMYRARQNSNRLKKFANCFNDYRVIKIYTLVTRSITNQSIQSIYLPTHTAICQVKR